MLRPDGGIAWRFELGRACHGERIERPPRRRRERDRAGGGLAERDAQAGQVGGAAHAEVDRPSSEVRGAAGGGVQLRTVDAGPDEAERLAVELHLDDTSGERDAAQHGARDRRAEPGAAVRRAGAPTDDREARRQRARHRGHEILELPAIEATRDAIGEGCAGGRPRAHLDRPGGADHPRAGVVNVGATASMHACRRERPSGDLRGPEGEVIRERDREADTSAAQPPASRDARTHEPVHGRPRVQVPEARADRVPGGSSGEVEARGELGRSPGVEGRRRGDRDRRPRSRRVERGAYAVGEPARRHDGAHLARVERERDAGGHLAAGRDPARRLERAPRGHQAELGNLQRIGGHHLHGALDRRERDPARRQAETRQVHLPTPALEQQAAPQLDPGGTEAARRRPVEELQQEPAAGDLEVTDLDGVDQGDARVPPRRKSPPPLGANRADLRGGQRETLQPQAAVQERERRIGHVDARHADDGSPVEDKAEIGDVQRVPERSVHVAQLDVAIEVLTQQVEQLGAHHLLHDVGLARHPEPRDEQREEDGGRDGRPAHGPTKTDAQKVAPRLTWTCQCWSPSGGSSGKPRSIRSGPTGDR